MDNEVMNEQIPQDEVLVTEDIIDEADNMEAPAEDSQQEGSKGLEFKFFRNCAASLKRFSILVFVINLFIAIGIMGAVTVVLALKLGVQMLSLLALPILTGLVILIVLARFVSALIYGFAEIVEKAEKK